MDNRINSKKRDFSDELLEFKGHNHLPNISEAELTTANTQAVKKQSNPISLFKKAFSFLILCGILLGFWFVGQGTIGIPDEVALQVLTFFLYKWYADNGYKLPRWLKK